MMKDNVEPRNNSGCELMSQARKYRSTIYRRTNKQPLAIAKEIMAKVRAGTYACTKRERTELIKNAEALGI